jgi:site-specific DNA-methyltransferase (adenine-specific)
MKPYYSDDLVTIYHGDCREWTGGSYDLVATDPPYGLITQSGYGRYHQRIEGDTTGASEWLLAEAGRLVVDPGWLLMFCGWHYVGEAQRALRPPMSIKTVAVWDKTRPSIGPGMRDQHEFILIARRGKPVETYKGGNVLRYVGQRGFHPNVKPQPLMRRLVQWFSPAGGMVFDPYMGSGSTLVAAKSLGRHAIGIEIEERYCEIAATRCSQEVLGLVSA